MNSVKTVKNSVPFQQMPQYRGKSFVRRTGGMPRFLSMAPMMDIMFNLLIFFLVTSTFQLPEGIFKARLPRNVGLESRLSVPTVPIRVFLQAKEQQVEIYLSCSISGNQAGQNISIPDYQMLYETLEHLQGQPGFDSDSPVVLAGQDQVNWQEIIQAYNAAIRAGYTKIVFSGWQ